MLPTEPQAGDPVAQQEERYRALAELSPDGVTIHAAGRHLYANKAAATLFGAATAEDVLGTEVLAAVEPSYRERVGARLAQLYAGRKAPLAEMRFLRRDGTAYDVEVASVPILYEGRPAALSLRPAPGDARRHPPEKQFARYGASLLPFRGSTSSAI